MIAFDGGEQQQSIDENFVLKSSRWWEAPVVSSGTDQNGHTIRH
jgi:hypothetical protein